MVDRRGVLILMYDLPVQTSKQRSDYQHFRKDLIKNGYLTLQESVYLKLLRNIDSAESETEKVRRFSPNEGTVNVLPMTLNGFKSFVAVQGEPFDFALLSDDVFKI